MFVSVLVQDTSDAVTLSARPTPVRIIFELVAGISCVAHGQEIFYPHTETPSEPKTQYTYGKHSLANYPRTQSMGVHGSTPLTDILLLPNQCLKDCMHTVARGHFKWLATMWQSMFTVDAFDEGARYLTSIKPPRCSGYQFLPLSATAGWKIKHYGDFLLYIAPVFTDL